MGKGVILMYWYDYINPYRIIRKIIQKKQITRESFEFLPAPYESNKVHIVLHMQDGLEIDKFKITAQKSEERFEAVEKLKLDIYEGFQKIKPVIESIGIAIPSLIDSYEYTSAIDNHVYETMQNLTRNNIDSFADLSNSVKESFKDSHDFWGEFGSNSIHKFGGHLGEVYVGEHLEQAGQNVVFPEMSNNEGFDLLLQGHEINVKTVSDAYQLSAHFAEYPDIPVIIPGDAAHIPDGAIHFSPSYGIEDLLKALDSHDSHLVFVDDALSHAEVMGQSGDALELASGNAHSLCEVGGDIHFPIITGILSGYREVNLLLEDKTTLRDATKNISLDIVGTGGGGIAGAKIGGMTGLAIGGPIGAAVGAFLGGVSGAVLGRRATNSVKRIPLEEAIDEYESAYEKMQTHIAIEQYNAKQSFQKTMKEEQIRLDNIALKAKKEIEVRINEIKESYHQQQFLTQSEFKNLIWNVNVELDGLIARLNEKLSTRSFMRRYLIPDIEVMSVEVAMENLIKYRGATYNLLTKYNEADKVPRNEVFKEIETFGLQIEMVIDILVNAEFERKQKEEEIRGCILKVTEVVATERANSFSNLEKNFISLREQIEKNLNPIIEHVTGAKINVQAESSKLGLG